MKKVILTILDGFGISENSQKNAIENANTRALNKLIKEFMNNPTRGLVLKLIK